MWILVFGLECWLKCNIIFEVVFDGEFKELKILNKMVVYRKVVVILYIKVKWCMYKSKCMFEN